MAQTSLLSRWASLSSATLHEAARKSGALPSAIKPLAGDIRVAGVALPVKSPPGDNLWIHRAIYAARPGEVLVIDTGDGVEFGYWGEVMAAAAMQQRIGGLVITGGVRDSQRLIQMGFPVFSAAVCIRGTGKDPAGTGHVGQPVVIGDVTVSRGDYVLGDADGVVVIPASAVSQVVDDAERRDRAEVEILARIRSGETTLAIYDLPG